MIDFSHTIKKYLSIVGREATVVKTNGGEDKFFAVVEQTWKRNKTNFDDKPRRTGAVYNEYSEILCPYDIDLKSYGKDDIIVIDGEKYSIQRTERITSLGRVQCHRGIIKKIREADGNVFN